MICLKTTTFVVSTTVPTDSQVARFCCDLLENYYLCSINNSRQSANRAAAAVVICLKTTTFVVSTTVSKRYPCSQTCCDLLENYYLCSINNSVEWNGINPSAVVICLKTTTFVVSTTVEYLYNTENQNHI